MPALLTESGFIDNANDVAKLKDSDFRQLIARGHANGLAKAFGLQKKAMTTPVSSSTTLISIAITSGCGVTFVAMAR